MMRTSTARRVAHVAVTTLVVACSDDPTTGPDPQASSAAGSWGTPTLTWAAPQSDRQIGLGWTDAAANETGFEIHRSATGATGPFTLARSVGANTTTATDDGLSAKAEYCYRVRAYREPNAGRRNFSTFSNVACARTYGMPGPPGGLVARPIPEAAIVLAWSDTSSDETAFRIYRATAPDAASWELVVTTPAGYTSATDGQRPVELQFCYRVAAANSYGESAPSPTDCTAHPSAPSELAAAGGTDAIQLTWTDRSAVEDGFEIERASADFIFSSVGVAPANATRFEDRTAAADTRYWYRIRATKDGGYTHWAPGYAQAMRSATAPAAPGDLLTLPAWSTAVSLQWSDRSANEEGFAIERSTDGGLTWVRIDSVSWNGTSTSDAPVATEQHICHRVVAFNGAGESPPSNVDCTTPPAAPTNLTGNARDDGGIELQWTNASATAHGTEVQRVECYTYYYYGYSYCWVTTIAWVGAGVSSYVDRSVVSGYPYTYQVAAFVQKGDRRGYSDVSAQIYVYAP